MKTATQLRVVETNAGESRGFSIKATGKAFRVLIDGLYSDKPKSITRELWSNAYDSHRMAGKLDAPFEVNLPNFLDPSFRVRDYGVGLSHEDVMGLYTTVFESSKEDTNEQIGKFGLGSKSPFSYTDTFSVTSWFNGTKRHYSAVVGSDDIPAIHLMSEEDTDEGNGLEVSFPVDRKDIPAFEEAARQVSKGFDTKPVILGGNIEAWPEEDVTVRGTGWYLTKRKGSDGLYAKMGCVLYPIPKEYLNKHSLAYLCGVVEFPIGSLEVTASRESLSFGKGEPTAESLDAKLREVSNEIISKINDAIDSAPSFQAALKVDQDSKGYLHYTKRKLILGHWHGITFDQYEHTPHLEVCQNSISSWEDRKSIRFVDGAMVRREVSHILLEDLSEGKKCFRSPTRVATWGRANRSNIEGSLWIRYRGSCKEESEELNRILWLYPDAEVLLVNDFPDPGTPVSTTKRKTRLKVYNCGLVDHELTDAEEKAGGIWVPILRNNIQCERGYNFYTSSTVNLRSIIPNKAIYFAPKPMWKTLEKGSQWTNVFDELDSIFLDKGLLDKFKQVILFGSWSKYPSLKHLPKPPQPSDEDINLLNFFNRFVRYSHPLTEDVTEIKSSVAEELTKKNKEVQSKYPLLRYYSEDNKQDFLDYIQLVDKQRKGN